MLAKELSSLQERRDQLKAEVAKYKDCDPQVVEEIRKFVSYLENFLTLLMKKTSYFYLSGNHSPCI